jgi:hypothetical protein
VQQDDPRLSQHSADRLIRELIRVGRQATDEETQFIFERLGNAPFDPREMSVPRELRGVTYGGDRLGERAPRRLTHLVQRVLTDAQWIDGTTEDTYLSDLRRAIRDPAARLVVYTRRGGHMAGVVAPNHMPAARRGSRARPYLYVVYSADRGTIVSGYQATDLDRIDIPQGALWLT